MDTREIAKEYRVSHWAGIMQERIRSGVSIKTYCQQSGIRENVYYYWQRKLREAACEEMLPSLKGSDIVPRGWAACEPAREGTGGLSTVSIEIGKCRVTATGNTSEELLIKVCGALMSIC